MANEREDDESVLIELTETQALETIISLQQQADNYTKIAQQVYENIGIYVHQISSYRQLGYNVRFFYDITTKELSIEPEEKIIGFQQQGRLDED